MEICIAGRVQGVGFRPFIDQLARQLGLAGGVWNDGTGVTIRVKGNGEVIEEFIRRIPLEKPPMAEITALHSHQTPDEWTAEGFRIVQAPATVRVDTPLTPDFALCESCAAEIVDKTNRRYFYPFTACTQCGPRYAITQRFPFERENTSMADYALCPDCLAEYTTPGDRRQHAQTSTCPACGIAIVLKDKRGKVVAGDYEPVFSLLALKLREGAIAAVKNTAGYLLLCDATNPAAVQRLRDRKHRPTKPFAVLFNDLRQLGAYLHIRPMEAEALRSPAAPIVVLPVKDKRDLATYAVAPGMDTIGAMLPYSGILLLIAQLAQRPLVATSGNLHGAPLCADEAEAERQLRPVADYFLHHSLTIQHPQDDSVVRFSRETATRIILRRARGMAPDSPIPYGMAGLGGQKILCLGSDLKNTITIVPNHCCYTSEYIGDLGHYDTYRRYLNTIDSYQHIMDFQPEVVLCDKHPLFESRQAIHQFPEARIIEIPHHEAHFAAVLQEHDLWDSADRVLGVIWDGIGFGDPHTMWGGEFFTYSAHLIKRVGHLQAYPWILGDRMAQYPKISALSASGCSPLLYPHFTANEWQSYSAAVHAARLKTTSMGRLFDAVAFVLGFHRPNTFEGEAALWLEKEAADFYQEHPHVDLVDYLEGETPGGVVAVSKLFLTIMEAARTRVASGKIALNFHYTLVCCIGKIARSHQCRQLAFSGGSFQNALLVDLITAHLSEAFSLNFHHSLSPNDENISFGQLSHYLHVAS
ncbi:Hydrogenase maturation protein, carbamoyltransferase HypF [Parapedobacter koreensis]|uniref:Carbamoyltransferase n=2 Tax=Parapedobacter koreensis TaxID=332977 RepID=A0A1H7TLB4_9SPHI|nr:Hydrogenase maturation protein, carbamoyltransferase HypF [Parapedobacter koreensis]